MSVAAVRPSDGRATVDGNPLPMTERPELCCRDAWWTFELAPTCDMHLRELMTVVDDDYDAFLADWCRQQNVSEFRPNPTELLSWGEAHRYPQEQATYLGAKS